MALASASDPSPAVPTLAQVTINLADALGNLLGSTLAGDDKLLGALTGAVGTGVADAVTRFVQNDFAGSSFDQSLQLAGGAAVSQLVHSFAGALGSEAGEALARAAHIDPKLGAALGDAAGIYGAEQLVKTDAFKQLVDFLDLKLPPVQAVQVPNVDGPPSTVDGDPAGAATGTPTDAGAGPIPASVYVQAAVDAISLLASGNVTVEAVATDAIEIAVDSMLSEFPVLIPIANFLIGEIIGALSGKPKAPQAFATIGVENGQIANVGTSQINAPSYTATARAMGDQMTSALQAALASVGGTIAEMPRIDIGVVDGHFEARLYSPAGVGYSGSDPTQIINQAVIATLHTLPIDGGDAFVKRAIANSSAADIAGLMQDIAVGQAYSAYQADHAAIDRAIAADPHGLAAQSWLTVLANAQQRLHLDTPVAGETVSRADFGATDQLHPAEGLTGSVVALDLSGQGIHPSDLFPTTSTTYDVAVDAGDGGRTQPHTDVQIDTLQKAGPQALEAVGRDGLLHRTQTLGPDTGILVKVDANGAVVAGLPGSSFADAGRGDSALAALAGSADTDGNGTLDARDADWSQFRVWVDKDGDGQVEAGELFRPEDVGVTAVSVTPDGTSSGNEVPGEHGSALVDSAGFLRTDGRIGTVQDIRLAYDAVAGAQGALPLYNYDPITGAALDPVTGLPVNPDTIAPVATLAGGAGNDTLVGSSGPETIMGGGGDDLLIAGSGNDYLYGGSGNDTLAGGAGSDTLVGGPGNDLFVAGSGSATLVGGGGQDTLSFNNATGPVNVNLAAMKAWLADGAVDLLQGIDTITGSAFDDTLIGGAAQDWLQAGGGDALLQGGSGRDTLVGGAGRDTLIAGSGADLLDAGNAGGSHTLIGGSGPDTLRGGNGNDLLQAGSGTDTLPMRISVTRCTGSNTVSRGRQRTAKPNNPRSSGRWWADRTPNSVGIIVRSAS